MNDRLPYADVSIAAVLVVLGIALAAYPWVGGVTFSLAALAALAGLAVVGTLAATHRIKPRGVTSGQIPWT